LFLEIVPLASGQQHRLLLSNISLYKFYGQSQPKTCVKMQNIVKKGCYSAFIVILSRKVKKTPKDNQENVLLI
jgi:hypothetical protein